MGAHQGAKGSYGEGSGELLGVEAGPEQQQFERQRPQAMTTPRASLKASRMATPLLHASNETSMSRRFTRARASRETHNGGRRGRDGVANGEWISTGGCESKLLLACRGQEESCNLVG